MSSFDNLRIITKDGIVHTAYEKLTVPRNKDTEHIYQMIFRVCKLQEEKPA